MIFFKRVKEVSKKEVQEFLKKKEIRNKKDVPLVYEWSEEIPATYVLKTFEGSPPKNSIIIAVISSLSSITNLLLTVL
ncbi:hypothetical protein H4V97_001398 [Flavobacterium sp. CG_23.5]|nr:hypothetical protein [Flavobacterium sp. CG_9.10]MBP2283080.1 hypothetical protein [Flavobacterium sp. CG_23.5]